MDECKLHTYAGKSSRDCNALKKLTFCQPVASSEDMEEATEWLRDPKVDYAGTPYEKPRVGGPFGEPLQQRPANVIMDPKDAL